MAPEPKQPLTQANMHRMLWEEAQRVRNGEAPPSASNAIATACGTILRSFKLKVDYHHLAGLPIPPIAFFTEE